MIIVKTLNLIFFQLYQVVHPVIGRSVIRDFLNGNSGRHSADIGNYEGYSIDKILSDYERGTIVVLDHKPQLPLFKYYHLPDNKGYWEYKKTGYPFMDSRLESIARILRPPARIRPEETFEDVRRSIPFIPEPKKEPCEKVKATNIGGVEEIIIGERCEYNLYSYNISNVKDECRKKLKWKIEFYACCDAKEVIRSIDDCSLVPSVFGFEKDKLIIKKVPDFWFGCIGVYPYLHSPSVKVRKISKVRGNIKRRLLFERKHNPNKDDMKYGDMTDEEFKKYYIPVCKKEHKIELVKLYRNNMFSMAIAAKINGTKVPWEDENAINQYCENEFKSWTNKSDDELFELFYSLIEWQSMGELETVALDILSKVKENKANTGVNYENTTLNFHAKIHESPQRFLNNEIIPKFKEQLTLHKGDISKVKLTGLGYPRFNTFADKIIGLGIIFNGTEGSKVELLEYECENNKNFKAKIEITIYDHFGLDIDDVRIDNPNEPRKHMDYHPFKFLAWAYLQRVRGYKPFPTQVKYEEIIEGEF